MLDRISVKNIIKDFHSSFSLGTNSSCKIDIFYFYGAPILLSILLMSIFDIPKIIKFDTLITFYSIFTALLFSFIYMLKEKSEDFTQRNQTNNYNVSKKAYLASSFAIIVALVSILTIFLLQSMSNILYPSIKCIISDFSIFTFKHLNVYYWMLVILKLLVISLFFIFIASLLITLKCMHEISRP